MSMFATARQLAGAGLCAAGLLLTPSAQALDILLSNDDGFETANIRALYQRLDEAGHDVAISAPTRNNSGTGGSVEFLRPITPLEEDSLHGSVEAGAPGVGTDPADDDVHYVDSTPVASVLYGLDVVAPKRWGGQPDLVISGPNEGNNLGLLNNSSGTFNNVLYAINRGVPAIAVSFAGIDGRADADLAPDAPEFELADVVVTLLQRLENQPGNVALLPPGVGLNVNVPEFEPGGAASLPVRFTRIGLASAFQPVFFESLEDSEAAQRFGAAVDMPAVSMVLPGETPPAGVTLPDDQDPRSEGRAAREGAVSISVIEGVAQARRSNEDAVRLRLDGVFDGGEK